MLCSSSRSCVNAAASPTVTAPVPRTTTALRFLLPITAPAPPRPALWNWSVERQAKGTRFSPAGPVESTLCHGPISSRTSCSRAAVSRPQKRPSAGRKSTLSSSTSTRTGCGALPVTIDGVVAGELHLGRERASDVAVVEDPGGRALAAHGQPGAGGHSGAGERPGREDQRVLRRQRVRARREFGEKVAEEQSLAADVQPGPSICRAARPSRVRRRHVEPQHVRYRKSTKSPHRGHRPRPHGPPGPRDTMSRPTNRPVN